MRSQDELHAQQQYEWASRYLAGLIQGPPAPPPDATPEEIRAKAIARIDRLRSFLEFLGNPHLSYRTVHVTGTSGKGSTASFLASILTSSGLRTGLHVSPYLQVETEKLQIDGRLMSTDAFASYVAAIDSEVQRWVALGNDPLTYGEFWVALTFVSMEREGCDIVVAEAGAGGRFDLTNLVEPDVSIITSVGLDHVRTLGATIPEIAWHKAGIIKPGTPAVVTVDDTEALEVIRTIASEQQAPLIELLPDRDYHWTWRAGEGGFLEADWLDRPVRLPLPGRFQASNAAVASRAARLLRDGDTSLVTMDAIEHGIERTRFPGRVEVLPGSPQVILDGAHNPEKVSAFVETLSLFPPGGTRRMILGSLGGHDFLSVARTAAAAADEVIVTAPSAIERTSAPVDEIVATVRALGRPCQLITEPLDALQAALSASGPDDQIVVTGSLYLVGAVREHWYPKSSILTQQTPFPEVNSE